MRHYSNVDQPGVWLCGEEMPLEAVERAARQSWPLARTGLADDCQECVRRFKARRS